MKRKKDGGEGCDDGGKVLEGVEGRRGMRRGKVMGDEGRGKADEW